MEGYARKGKGWRISQKRRRYGVGPVEGETGVEKGGGLKGIGDDQRAKPG